MPLLEYRCRECAHVFERLVLRTEGADRAECPACGDQGAQRLLSVFATARGAGGESTPFAGGCCGGTCCAN